LQAAAAAAAEIELKIEKMHVWGGVNDRSMLVALVAR
jgi:hypothetical protein